MTDQFNAHQCMEATALSVIQYGRLDCAGREDADAGQKHEACTMFCQASIAKQVCTCVGSLYRPAVGLVGVSSVQYVCKCIYIMMCSSLTSKTYMAS